MKNIALVEARYDSTRLKGKVLLNLNEKFKTIDFVLQNLLASKKLNSQNICLLTSKKKSNRKIIDYVKKKYKIKFFMGSEENVYLRIFDFVKNLKVKNLIRITADNPLVDPAIIDKFISSYETKNLDYMSIRSMEHTKNWNEKSDFPEGISLEIFNRKKFLMFKKKINKKNSAYPTWFFYNSTNKEIIKKKFFIFKRYKGINLKMRVTLDTSKDLIFLRKIIKFYNLLPGKNNIYKILKNKKKINKNFLHNINKKKKIAYKVINL